MRMIETNESFDSLKIHSGVRIPLRPIPLAVGRSSIYEVVVDLGGSSG